MAKTALRIRDAAGRAFRRVIIWTSGDESAVSSSPTITAGSGAPTTTDEPQGSLYLRTDGGAGTTAYAYNGSSWDAI